MSKVRMRSDLAEEGMSVPAGKSFESYDTLAKICPTLGDSPRGLVRRLQGIRFGIG